MDLLRRSGQVHFIYSLVPVPNAGLCDLGVSPMAPSDSNLDLQLLRQQLRGFQILQAILTHQQGYPDQLSFHDFRQQYIGLIPEHLRPESPVPNEKEVRDLWEIFVLLLVDCLSCLPRILCLYEEVQVCLSIQISL